MFQDKDIKVVIRRLSHYDYLYYNQMPFINVKSNVIDTTSTAKYGINQHRQWSYCMNFEDSLDVILYKNS